MHLGTLGFSFMWRYLSNSPVSPSMTTPAHSHNNFNGNLLEAGLIGVDSADVVSIQSSMTYCVNVLMVLPVARVLFDVVNSIQCAKFSLAHFSPIFRFVFNLGAGYGSLLTLIDGSSSSHALGVGVRVFFSEWGFLFFAGTSQLSS